jgi:hypothetical protein
VDEPPAIRSSGRFGRCHLRRIWPNRSNERQPGTSVSMEHSSGRRALRIIVVLCCLAFGVGALLYNYRADGPPKHTGLVTLLLLLMVYGLYASGIVKLPARIGVSILFPPSLKNLVKAAASYAMIFIWTLASKRFTPDTPLGVAIILVPDAVFMVAMLVYLCKSFIGRAK